MFCLGHDLCVALITSIIEVEGNRQIFKPYGEIFEQCTTPALLMSVSFVIAMSYASRHPIVGDTLVRPHPQFPQLNA
jgi:hypothetical protein